MNIAVGAEQELGAVKGVNHVGKCYVFLVGFTWFCFLVLFDGVQGFFLGGWCSGINPGSSRGPNVVPELNLGQLYALASTTNSQVPRKCHKVSL